MNSTSRANKAIYGNIRIMVNPAWTSEPRRWQDMAPSPAASSPLQYACHFADKRVYRLPRNAVASSPALTPSSLLVQA